MNKLLDRSQSCLIASALAIALLGGCATTGAADPRDPIEPVNRAVFEFNDTVDRAVLKPVARGYKAVLPEPVRTGISNFFSNLRDPWIGLNQLLQGKVEEGVTDFMRFVVNTTFGLAGIFDVASEGGMEKHDEDFGQTLGVWGLDTGPYLVLPFLGPSSVRDGVGRAADSVAYLPWQGPRLMDAGDEIALRNSLTATDVVQTRAGLLDATNVLEEAALDRYAFVRDAYFQRRRNQVYDGRPPAEPYEDIDYEEAPPAAPAKPDAGKAPPAAPAPAQPSGTSQDAR
ncbi:MAG: VacJ family lipoprotein [Burkholderiales bacterium]|nr:VacJ family lipoprotein [Burkholderiales bacterium]PZN03283.1 MAG: ABC transporter [Pseudomonadota bacterium]